MCLRGPESVQLDVLELKHQMVRGRLRELHKEREKLALAEVRKPRSDPFFATSVTVAASGIVR